MQLSKRLTNPLITGTLLLTATGLLSRIIGFFYRIFLSRTIGAEGLGIYQLIFPVLSLGIAFCASGIQTAISRYVAADNPLVDIQHRKTGSPTAANSHSASHTGMAYLYAGMLLSVSLSILCAALLNYFSDFIAVNILNEVRCCKLLVIMSYSIPFACIHSCINGYYYGRKKTLVPAITQLSEQLVRVISVYVLYLICIENHKEITPAIAVWGLVFGEFSSMLIATSCTRFYRLSKVLLPRMHAATHHAQGTSLLPYLQKIGGFSIPLTANRVTYHIFASMEAILIPLQLKAFGYTSSQALSVFGILTGMALPMILFPSALTNSFSVLLMPTISEAAAMHDQRKIHLAIRKTFLYCMVLGLICTLGFLLTGRFIGQYIFHNTLAGTFILILSWICPFLYLATTFSSILHGLGKAGTAFFINMSGCILRIACILLLVPRHGIRCYLYSMLAAQIIVTILCIYAILCKQKMPLTSVASS